MLQVTVNDGGQAIVGDTDSSTGYAGLNATFGLSDRTRLELDGEVQFGGDVTGVSGFAKLAVGL